MRMRASSRKSGIKKIYGLLLSFALVFCFYGVSFSEQQVIQNLESTIVEMAPGAFEAKLQQIVPSATRGANYSVGGLFTCNTASVDFLMPINIFSEGEDIYFVSPIYCGNVGGYTKYIMLSASYGGVVQKVYASEGTFSETGVFSLTTKLAGGLPPGVYRMHIILLMAGNWIVSPDIYTFIVS